MQQYLFLLTLKSIEQWCILLLKNWTFYLREEQKWHCVAFREILFKYTVEHVTTGLHAAYLRLQILITLTHPLSKTRLIIITFFSQIDDNKSTCYQMSWSLFNDEVPVNLDSGKQSKNELPSTGSTSTARSPSSEICWAWAAWSGAAGSSWGWFCSCPWSSSRSSLARRNTHLWSRHDT